MSETDTNSKSAGIRFPFINLEKAIGRAKELFDADQKGREMTLTAAFDVWGYSGKSSGGFQTVAALKMYDLLKDSNGGDSRKVGLTGRALRYFRDEREDEKKKLSREFALKPKLIAALWTDWHTTPPADPIARSHLKAERGLNDQSARSLLAIYRENLDFSELKSGDKVPETEPAQETSMPPGSPETRHILDRPAASFRPPVATSPMLQEVFNLDEGPVTLSFPSALSQESYEELKDQLELFLRRAQRRAALLARYEDPSYRAQREAEIIRRASAPDDDEGAA
jgi:hypothetical protein